MNEAHHLVANLDRLLAKIDPSRLVVQSMPFGALIDNDTGKAITPPIADPDVAYGIAAAIKLAAHARR